MNRGVPPTARKARTGLFTPPGRDRLRAVEQVGRGRGLVGVGRAVQRGHDPSVPCEPERRRRLPTSGGAGRPGPGWAPARCGRRSAAAAARCARCGSVQPPPSTGRAGVDARRRPSAQVRGVDVGQRHPLAARRRGRRRRPATVQTRRADSVPAADDAEHGDDREHPQQRRDVRRRAGRGRATSEDRERRRRSSQNGRHEPPGST